MSTLLSNVFDVGDRDLAVPTSDNWVIGCMTKWLRFSVTFLHFFENQKHDFLRFLRCCTRFLEHWYRCTDNLYTRHVLISNFTIRLTHISAKSEFIERSRDCMLPVCPSYVGQRRLRAVVVVVQYRILLKPPPDAVDPSSDRPARTGRLQTQVPSSTYTVRRKALLLLRIQLETTHVVVTDHCNVTFTYDDELPSQFF